MAHGAGAQDAAPLMSLPFPGTAAASRQRAGSIESDAGGENREGCWRMDPYEP